MKHEKTPHEGMASRVDLTDWTHKKTAFLRAFERAATNIQTACQKVGISRQSYYNWMQMDMNFSRAIADLREGMIDDAETQLYKAIKNGNLTAIIFFLKCRGKKRGYLERQEVYDPHESLLFGKKPSRDHMRKIGQTMIDIAEDLKEDDSDPVR